MNNILLALVFTFLVYICSAQTFCENSGHVLIDSGKTFALAKCKHDSTRGSCALLEATVYEEFALYSSTWSLFVAKETDHPFLQQSGNKTTTKKGLILGTFYNDVSEFNITLKNLNFLDGMSIYYQIRASYIDCAFITPNSTTTWNARPSRRPVQWNVNYDTQEFGDLRLWMQDETIKDYAVRTSQGIFYIDDGLLGGNAFLSLTIGNAKLVSNTFKIVYNDE